jgi:uncharacterized alkaline shock family protein YloU
MSLGPAEGGDRGGLIIADKVVEKVAAHAISGVAHATGAPRRVLGVSVGNVSDDTRARVNADVDGDVASVTVDLAVEWPTPVRGVVEDVRRRIRDDVYRITGVTVQQVDIEVVSMATLQHDVPRVR